MPRNAYGMAEAKAKLSEVVARAKTHGPQEITVHGKPAAVVVSAEEWEARTKPTGNLVEFFMNSPFRRYQVTTPHMRGKLRNADL